MKIIKDHNIYKFSHDMGYVDKVVPGEVFMVKTNDCFFQQIRSEDQLVTEIDFSKVNPAIGPIYVEGAQPGDLLKIKILDIDIDDKGVAIVLQGGGVLAKEASKSKTRIVAIEDGYALFNNIKIPINPMIGVIGLAPAKEDGEWITAVPWKHGGNMDTTDIKAGSNLYLPVRQKGALLALGDCHGAMGDGEVSMAGLEIPANVILQVELIKGKATTWPLVETKDEMMIIASGDNVDQAIETVTSQAVEYLSHGLDISWEDAYILASISLNLRISQVVNEKKTVRGAISKNILTMGKLINSLK